MCTTLKASVLILPTSVSVVRTLLPGAPVPSPAATAHRQNTAVLMAMYMVRLSSSKCKEFCLGGLAILKAGQHTHSHLVVDFVQR